jgi:hypothetical protein
MRDIADPAERVPPMTIGCSPHRDAVLLDLAVGTAMATER